jgi:hypothetical protein
LTNYEINDSFDLRGSEMMLVEMGVVLLTIFYVIWLVLELRHREEVTRVLQRGSGGDSDITDFRFGWKLSLAFFLGIPVLVILWTLII